MTRINGRSVQAPIAQETEDVQNACTPVNQPQAQALNFKDSFTNMANVKDSLGQMTAPPVPMSGSMQTGFNFQTGGQVLNVGANGSSNWQAGGSINGGASFDNGPSAHVDAGIGGSIRGSYTGGVDADADIGGHNVGAGADDAFNYNAGAEATGSGR